MIKQNTLGLLVAATLAASIGSAFAQEHAHDAPVPPKNKWSFSGVFGTYDRAQLQRGFKVYKEVCQNCHSLNLLSFRNLADAGGPGFSVGQVESVAAEYKIPDGPNDQGEMFERNGRPGDRFPQPGTWKNEAQARSLYNGTVPPDMSVLAKARTYERGFPWFLVDALPFFSYQEHGVDYIVALLKGYKDKPPAGVQIPSGGNYNEFFPGNSIAMPPPLSDGRVEYTDGTPNTLDQQSKDVAAFMMWAAEPHLEARKRIGFQVMIFLIVFSGLLYFTKKKVWKQVELHS
jgi:cytochrome c1